MAITPSSSAADIRHAYNLRVPSDAHRAGQLTFSNTTTSGPAGGGNAIASFLLGNVSSFSRYVSTIFDAAELQNRFFFFGQDTWQVSPKLTVNYGLRWENYAPQYVNAAGNGGRVSQSTGEVLVAGSQGVSLNMNTHNKNLTFAPRLGIAYKATNKTVIRVGYGRGFDLGIFGAVFGHNVTQNLPVLASQQSILQLHIRRCLRLRRGRRPHPIRLLSCLPSPKDLQAIRLNRMATVRTLRRRMSGFLRLTLGILQFNSKSRPRLQSKWLTSETKALMCSRDTTTVTTATT